MKYIDGFRQNLFEGIEYYRDLAGDIMRESEKLKAEFLDELDRFEMMVQGLVLEPVIAE